MKSLEQISEVTYDEHGQFIRPKVKKLPSEHSPYKLNGKRIAGTTTISGRDPEGKEAINWWAGKLGLAGVCHNAVKTHSANIGTMAHKMVEAHLAEVDGMDIGIWIKWMYGEHEWFELYRHYATIAYRKYLEWRKDNPTFMVIATELSLVDEDLLYGGMIDIYGELNGKKVLLDIKTSSSVYSSHKIQVGGGYKNLLAVNGYEVDRVLLLKISRDEDEPYEVVEIKDTELQFEKFGKLLDGYYLDKVKGE